MFDDIASALQANGGQSATGEMDAGMLGLLNKALQSTSGVVSPSDPSGLTGGAALRVQSLEQTLLSTIQENDHFKLFNILAKSKAIATVDEWTEQRGVGGFLGGSTNGEVDAVADATGDYQRRVGMVKFLMTKRQISLVTATQGSLADAEATEYQNGALQLLTDAEFLSFNGDSSVVPTEFDGLRAQLENYNSGSNVIDALGASANDITWINRAVQTVVGFGNFGTSTNILCSPQVQADFDNNLDPAFRVSLTANTGPTLLGTTVEAVRSMGLRIKFDYDTFLLDEPQRAMQYLSYPAYINAALAPTLATTLNASGGASSNWQSSHAGTYYYWVVGINNKGFSAGVQSSQITVAAGNSVTLTITRSAGAAETGYAIYRGKRNGPNAASDARLVKRVPVAGATTTYIDLNRDIPGSTEMYVLNLKAGMNALTWRQFLPMMKFNLAAVNSPVIPWLQILMGYLRIGKRGHHVVIKNIIPSGATWKPF